MIINYPMKKLLILSSLILLSACSTPTPVIVKPVLPDYILQPCNETKVDVHLNSDLLLKILYLKADLNMCSAKQKALVSVVTK